ncbi:MAG: HlyD family efflux transporter periplasmic adaptor subunit [Pseudodesulfovibrio sp.]
MGIVFTALLVVGALFWIWQSDLIDINLLSPTGREAVEEVRTVTIAPTDVSLEVSLSGVFEPLDVINVVAPFAGTVAEKHFVWGQKVDKGAILFSLDTGEVTASLRDAKSEYIKAKQEYDKLLHWGGSSEFKSAQRSLRHSEEDLKLKKKRLEQASELKKVGIIPNNEYEQTEEEYNSAKNEVAANLDKFNEEKEKGNPENVSMARMKTQNAKEKLDALQLKVDSGVVLAPVSGVVLKPMKKRGDTTADIVVGSTVSLGEPVAAVGDLAGLRIMSKVDEVDIDKLSPGQKVMVTGDAFPGRTLVGRISDISSTATSESRDSPPAFDVQTTIRDLPPDFTSHIRLGMSANLQVQVYDNSEAIMIPIQAVHRTPQGLTVDVLDKETRETRTATVTTGVTSLSDVEITSGLAPGEQVVVP